MSFFGKLKDRLFKSSSRLEEGLDAIVAEGGEVEPSDTPEPGAARDPAPGETAGWSVEPAVEEQPLAPPDAPKLDPKPVSEPVTIPPDNPEEIPQPVPAEAPDRSQKFERDAEPPSAPAPAAPDPYREESPRAGSLPPIAEAAIAEEARTDEGRGGFFGRLLGRRPGAGPVMRRVVDDEMLESLEDLLIASDMGVDTATRVTANLAESHFGRRLSTDEIKAVLAAEIARIMEGVATPLPLYQSKPQVVLVVGVNGSGKTTTIGKLASQFRAAGKTVVIAAGDTFRAAAVEQLQNLGRPCRRAGDDRTAGLGPRQPGFRSDDEGAGRESRSLADRHGGAAAEPRRPDGGAGKDRAGDPQEGPGRAA